MKHTASFWNIHFPGLLANVLLGGREAFLYQRITRSNAKIESILKVKDKTLKMWGPFWTVPLGVQGIEVFLSLGPLVLQMGRLRPRDGQGLRRAHTAWRAGIEPVSPGSSRVTSHTGLAVLIHSIESLHWG